MPWPFKKQWYEEPFVITVPEPDGFTHIITDRNTFQNVANERGVKKGAGAFTDHRAKECWYYWDGPGNTWGFERAIGHEQIHRLFPQIQEDSMSVWIDLDNVFQERASLLRDGMVETLTPKELETLKWFYPDKYGRP